MREAEMSQTISTSMIQPALVGMTRSDAVPSAPSARFLIAAATNRHGALDTQALAVAVRQAQAENPRDATALFEDVSSTLRQEQPLNAGAFERRFAEPEPEQDLSHLPKPLAEALKTPAGPTIPKGIAFPVRNGADEIVGSAVYKGDRFDAWDAFDPEGNELRGTCSNMLLNLAFTGVPPSSTPTAQSREEILDLLSTHSIANANVGAIVQNPTARSTLGASSLASGGAAWIVRAAEPSIIENTAVPILGSNREIVGYAVYTGKALDTWHAYDAEGNRLRGVSSNLLLNLAFTGIPSSSTPAAQSVQEVVDNLSAISAMNAAAAAVPVNPFKAVNGGISIISGNLAIVAEERGELPWLKD